MQDRRQIPLVRLLLVDDDPLIQSSMAAALGEIGFSVRSAEDGLVALAQIRREIPDILLSDLNMPRMSGFELLRVVRRHFPSIHLIAMSGAFSGNEVPSGVIADAFYQKASGMRCLLRIIERFPQLPPLPVHQRTASAPLWILRNGYDASGEPCVSIVCPQCRRAFQQQIGGSLSLVREVQCAYCRTTVYYAIVEPVDRSPAAAFPRARRTTDPASQSQLHT